MIILAALVATVVLAFRVWSRLDQMDTAIAALTARVGALEHARAQRDASVSQTTTVHAAPPVIQPISAREPQVRPTPAPTPAPTLVEPPVPPAASRFVPPIVTPAVPAMGSSPAREASRDALERRIGSRWLLYVGVVAIVVGVAYFEKLSVDNHWISETTRVLQGGVAGLLLIAGGLHFVRKGYRLYGQILSGSGVAILYVSTYAAFNFYHLLSQPVAFGVMSGVTMLAAWLADRQRSQGLALVAVGGGFATPFLLPTSTDAEAALFGYDTFLIAGTMFLSRRRDWPTLNVVSYGFTVLTFFTWAEQFLPPIEIPDD